MPVSLLEETQANYTDAATIGPSQQIVAVQFFVSAPYSVLYQVAKLDSSNKAYFDENEQIANPGQGGFTNCRGIRFRNYGSNSSVVLASGYFADDPVSTGATPSSATLSTSGQTGGSGNILSTAAFGNGTVNVPDTGVATLIPMTGFDVNSLGSAISTAASPGGVAGRLILPQSGAYYIEGEFIGDDAQNWGMTLAFYGPTGALVFSEQVPSYVIASGSGVAFQRWSGLRTLAPLSQVAIFGSQTNSAGSQAISLGRLNVLYCG